MSGYLPGARRAWKPRTAVTAVGDPSAGLPHESEAEFPDPGEKYAAIAYSLTTLAAYARTNARYESWCASIRVKPYSASAEPAAAFIAHLKPGGDGAETVASALAWGYARAGYPSPKRDPAFRRVVAGAKCQPGRRLRPIVRVEEITTAVGSLDPAIPADARTGALALLAYASGLPYGALVRADRATTVIDEDGVQLALTRGTHHVSRGSSPATDPAWWLSQWLLHVGTTPGPLFVACDERRGGWSRVPLDANTARSSIERLWSRAGIEGPPPSFELLRRSFAASGVRVAPPVAVAHQLRMRVRDMAASHHLSGIARDDHWAGRGRGEGRRRR